MARIGLSFPGLPAREKEGFRQKRARIFGSSTSRMTSTIRGRR
jgi:hypothetical protein